MMETKVDAIANAFGITTPTDYPKNEMTVANALDEKTSQLQEQIKENINEDYRVVRKNLQSMIESTMDMIPNLVDLVSQAESPRMYESAATFMKMVADLNKDLLVTSRELDKGSEKGYVPQMVPVGSENTNIYIGTGSDIFSRLSKPKVVDHIDELPVINS
jgi:BMFP domain-containing protein YqiC